MWVHDKFCGGSRWLVVGNGNAGEGCEDRLSCVWLGYGG